MSKLPYTSKNSSKILIMVEQTHNMFKLYLIIVLLEMETK